MNMETTIVRRPGRLIGLARVLDAVSDADLDRTIELLIAMRDARDGDPDIEPNGDELDVSVPGWALRSRYMPDDRLAEHKFADLALAETEDDEDADPAEDDDPGEDGDTSEDDDPAGDAADDLGEVSAWPEYGSDKQPACMMGGIAVQDEDAEPRFVPASMDRPEPANVA